MTWTPKANLRGPAGLNATGAAEDDQAVSLFVKSAVGTTATRAELEALFGHGMRVVNGRKYRTVAGTIRNIDGSGWALIEDTQHRSQNVVSITEDATGVYVNYGTLGVTKVVSFIAVTDETLATNGFTVGSSVALTNARIELHHSKSIADYVSYDGTNWVSLGGVFTGLSYSAGVLSMSHASVGIGSMANTGNGGSVTSRGGAARAVFAAASSAVGHQNTKIEFYDNAGTLLTAPSTAMKCFVQRSSSSPQRVPPAEVHEGRFVNSNIWFIGLFEVAN